MEYQVFARKWRPQTFEDVVGQEHVVRTLKNAIDNGRIAHAFIFSGPRGVGKTSIARIMAKAANCGNGPTPVPCNMCSNCREITDGISIDVREIDGASNRGIDEIRELREFIKFSPVSSRYKIFIIDEVHMLTREAFNALLKTLEEPPAHVIFIFATTEINKVPATILSRCQRYDFRRSSLKQILNNVKKIAEAEGIVVSEKSLLWIAEAADGSMRDALSIFDQIISFAGHNVADESVEELLGLTDRKFLLQLSQAVFDRDAAACLKIIDDGYYAGIDMKFFYQMLMGHFRKLFLAKVMGDEREMLDDMTGDELTTLSQQAAEVSKETVQRLLDVLITEEENIKRSATPRINLESTLVRMAYMEPMIPIDVILSRMESLEKRLACVRTKQRPADTKTFKSLQIETASDNKAAEKNNVSFAAPEEVHGQNSGQIRESVPLEKTWENIKAFIKMQNQPLWSKIEAGRLLSQEDGIMKIGFPRDYVFLEDINDKAQKERLAELICNFLGEEIVIKIVAIETSVSSENQYVKNGLTGHGNIQDMKREALKHPVLQKVLDVFGSAEVREVSPRKNHH